MKKGYKLSKYNYFFEVDGVDYVYNTFSGGLSELEKGGKERLLNFDSYDGNMDSFYTAAVANGFIVKADVDELEILNFYRSDMICQERQTVYEILPTTACNARCFYCFEEGVKFHSMSMETAKQVCKFIIEQNNHTQRILIQWFGGEPLLNPKVITYITQTLDTELASKGIQVNYQMTTNGSLVTDEMVKPFKDVWHISKVQITLDGPKSTYEKRKAYVNLPNAFEKVITNINALANAGIRVAIRLNYDNNNIADIMELIDYLGTAIINKSKVLCYGYPLFSDDPNSAPDVRENALKLIDINRKIVQNDLCRGKNVFNLHFIQTKCYACLRHSFLITPDGKLAKCSMAMEEKDFIGDIYSPYRLSNAYLRWCSTELSSQECYSCKFLPLCQGGCKAGHLGYSHVKHYIFKNCFDEVLAEIVRANKNQYKRLVKLFLYQPFFQPYNLWVV